MIQDEGMEGVLVEEADSSEEVGVKVEAGKKWKVRKGRFGGGSGSAGRSSSADFAWVVGGGPGSLQA